MRFGKFTFVVAALVLTWGGTAQAATLDLLSLSEIAQNETKLFTTEAKHDQSVGGVTRGKDIFIRSAQTSAEATANLTWGASGTVYDWSLSRLDDAFVFTVGGVSSTLNLPGAPGWNAFTFWTRSDWSGFETASTLVSLLGANGATLSETFSVLTTDAQGGPRTTNLAFALPGLAELTELNGQLRFDFAVAQGTNANSSPNGRLAFGVDSFNVSPVPLPAALPMLIAALGGMGLIGRRARRRAKAHAG